MEEEGIPSNTPLIAQVVESFITSLESLADTFPIAMIAIANSQTKLIEEITTSFIGLVSEFLEFHHSSKISEDDIIMVPVSWTGG